MPLVKRYTFTTGARLSSSQLNTNFDDIYNTYNAHRHTNQGNDAPQITTSGIAGGVLTPTNFYNPIKFSVYANANQTIVTNTNTKINLNARTFDTSNNFDTTTNYRFTAPVPGFYYFTACVYITATTSYIIPFLYKNNLNVLQGTTNYGSAGNDQQVTVTGLLQLTANDYIELFVVQYSGSNKTTIGAIAATYMHGYLVSAT